MLRQQFLNLSYFQKDHNSKTKIFCDRIFFRHYTLLKNNLVLAKKGYHIQLRDMEISINPKICRILAYFF